MKSKSRDAVSRESVTALTWLWGPPLQTSIPHPVISLSGCVGTWELTPKSSSLHTISRSNDGILQQSSVRTPTKVYSSRHTRSSRIYTSTTGSAGPLMKPGLCYYRLEARKYSDFDLISASWITIVGSVDSNTSLYHAVSAFTNLDEFHKYSRFVHNSKDAKIYPVCCDHIISRLRESYEPNTSLGNSRKAEDHVPMRPSPAQPHRKH